MPGAAGCSSPGQLQHVSLQKLSQAAACDEVHATGDISLLCMFGVNFTVSQGVVSI